MHTGDPAFLVRSSSLFKESVEPDASRTALLTPEMQLSSERAAPFSRQASAKFGV